MMPGETLRIDPDLQVGALCVLLHGRGQSPQDFSGLAEGVAGGLAGRGVAFALPAAPGGSWYDARAADALTDVARAQLAASLDAVGTVIDSLGAEWPGRPLVLAGFSKGACVALELAFAGMSRPDAVVAFTGCRVGQAGDARPSTPLGWMPVILTGADAGPWIPLAAFVEAVADLGRAGARLRAELFSGRCHEVSRPEAMLLADLLTDLAALRTLPERATP